jgi:hypothetical protein
MHAAPGAVSDQTNAHGLSRINHVSQVWRENPGESPAPGFAAGDGREGACYGLGQGATQTARRGRQVSEHDQDATGRILPAARAA